MESKGDKNQISLPGCRVGAVEDTGRRGNARALTHVS